MDVAEPTGPQVQAIQHAHRAGHASIENCTVGMSVEKMKTTALLLPNVLDGDVLSAEDLYSLVVSVPGQSVRARYAQREVPKALR